MGQRHRIDRRQFVGGASAATLAAMLASCTGGGQTSEQQSQAANVDPGTLQWWDQFRPLTELFQNSLFDPYMADHPEVTIERRQMDGESLGTALQVGRRSNQLPDVHSTAGLGSSAAALVSEDWFQPIGGFADFASSPLSEQIYDGIHRFDDEIYAIPLFSGRWHDAIPWLNTQLLEQAGVDPEESPATWDDLRAAARSISQSTEAHGIVVPMKEANYLDALTSRLAMAAGAPGPGGVDWATGEYIYNSQPYIDAIEFLLALQSDGAIHPSSPSMGPRDGRARWAAGEAGIYMWGPWFIGGLLVDEPESVERGLGVWHVPCPETTRNFVYSGPAPGVFWLSSQSDQPEVAADLLLQMTTREFQAELAAAMDQPPALLDVVAEADVHPAYERSIQFLEEDMRIGPVPEVGNPGVWRVSTEMRDIHPDLGEIVQSVLTGSTTDIAGALQRFNDERMTERDRALDAVAGDGDEVSVDDWVFANWDPAADYDQQAYDGR